MHKRFNAGEMRTQIIIKACKVRNDADNYAQDEYVPLFDGQAISCKWVNVHGKEIYEAARLDLRGGHDHHALYAAGGCQMPDLESNRGGRSQSRI